MAQNPLFLERRSYRRRRVMDAVRLLPLLGLVLWMVPLLWGVPEAANSAEPMPMASALRYVFGIWVLMVVASFALSRGARDGGTPPLDPPPDGPR